MVTIASAPPRYRLVPDGEGSLGDEVVELAASAGLELDGWQEDVVRAAFLRDGDKWSAFEVGMLVARQNGKGAILEAIELAGLFLLGEELIIHSAHMVDTAMEAWMRLRARIEDTPDLHAKVRNYPSANGREGITLKNGCRIRFASRTKSGRRGFSADRMIYDEAMFLAEFAHGATLPTLSARPNPQVIYAGSAVDQTVHDNGVVFTRVRERGIEGEQKLAWFEWSVEGHPDSLTDDLARDREAIEQANPALGIRIDPDYVLQEQRAMDPRSYATERFSMGDWPDTTPGMKGAIDFELWMSLEDPLSSVQDPVCLGLDKSPDGTVSIAAAGWRSDGLLHVEIIDNQPGTKWVAKRLAELAERHSPHAIVYDGYGPISSLVAEIEKEDLELTSLTSTDHARAAGMFAQAVSENQLRHRASPQLTAAVRGAATRPLGDSWAWSRRSSNIDISPLVAASLALDAAVRMPEEGEFKIW